VRRGNAFTLLEVVVAGGLLAVGMLALLMLQAQSLQTQRRVREVREIVSVAEGELERRAAAATVGASPCQLPAAVSPVIVACRASTEACSGASPPCGLASADRAVRVTIQVAGRGGQKFELSGVHARFPAP
jgi:type II secretory pathway component PulJ